MTDCGLRIMNYELLKYQDKNNAVQRARQRRRKAKTTALFLKGYIVTKSERPSHEGQHAVSRVARGRFSSTVRP